MIKTETALWNPIACYQRADLGAQEKAAHLRLVAKYPNAKCRTDASVGYNCHGLTFLSRRAWLTQGMAIATVLKDDHYREVALDETLPGDVIVYYSDTGDPNHSGMVVEAGGSALEVRVCSKWAYAGEFVHGIRECPEEYGPIVRFYRCRR